MGLTELGPELGGPRSARRRGLARRRRRAARCARRRGTREVELARAVANQTAVAIKKIQVLERLTEKNLIRDFFDDLAAQRAGEALEGRAARLGCDLTKPHVVVPRRRVDERSSARLLARRAARCSIGATRRCGRSFPSRRRGGRVVDEIRRIHAQSGSTASIGVSSVCAGAGARARLRGGPACPARRVGDSARRRARLRELGPYKYLLRIALDPAGRDSTIDAVDALAALRRRAGRIPPRRRWRNISPSRQHQLDLGGALRPSEHAPPAPAPDRRPAGLDLRRDDWLMIEIAVKMVRVRAAQGIATPHT